MWISAKSSFNNDRITLLSSVKNRDCLISVGGSFVVGRGSEILHVYTSFIHTFNPNPNPKGELIYIYF